MARPIPLDAPVRTTRGRIISILVYLRCRKTMDQALVDKSPGNRIRYLPVPEFQVIAEF